MISKTLLTKLKNILAVTALLSLLPSVGWSETTTDDLPFLSGTDSPPSSITANNSAGCYDPTQENRILEIYGQAFVERIQPLLQEAYQENRVDPRLIYHRMVGEGLGDPDIRNPSSGAYGIFQYLGAYSGRPPHETRLRTLYNQHSANSADDRRYVQVLYHVRHYVREGIEGLGGWARCGSGSGQSLWNNMTALQQATLLGWGNCSSASIRAEENILSGGVSSYDTSIVKSLINDNQPLCESFTQ